MNKIFFLFVILSFSCEKNTTPLKKTNKAISKKNIKTEVKELNYSTVYIDALDEFYEFNGYFIPLYYKKGYSEEIEENILSSNTKLIEESIECSRIKISDLAANKHLATSNLEKVTVFDANQNKIKELTLNNFEYYSDALSSCFIASYPMINNNLKGKLIISSNFKDSFEVKKNTYSKKEY